MKFKNYFNNLEKYWSANFLALLAFTFFFFVITRIVINIVYFAFQATNFSEYIELLDKSYLFGIEYPTFFFSITCFLSACISIFYIFIVISPQKWLINVSAFLILIFWCIFFVHIHEISKAPFVILSVFIALIFVPMTFFSVLISIGIYLALLFLELIPKFKVPQSIISQNSIFKKYIRVFYCLYFVIICAIICVM